MKTKAIEHVVIRTVSGPAYTGLVLPGALTQFACLRCGQVMRVHEEQPLHLLQKHAAAFTLMHEDCKGPSPQLPLPKHERGDLEPIDAPSTFSKTSGALQAQTTSEWPLGPATTWIDLWADLKEALADHEYEALRAWTPFPECLRESKAFCEVAEWAWREAHTVPGALQERPMLLRDCVYNAVKHWQEAHPVEKLSEAERPRTREHKRPMLHIHHSNDTMPSKPRVGTAHVIVSTADQADAIRGTLCSSVQLHTGDWNNPLLAYLACILEPMGVKVNADKLTKLQRQSLGVEGGA
jgi:hypothetical protein